MASVPEALAVALDHFKHGRLQDAEIIARRIVAAVPRHAESIHLLGLIAHRCGHLDAAVDHMLRSIALEPRTAGFHVNLGGVYHAQHRISDAADAYRAALALRPSLREAHNNLGNLHKDRGDAPAAVASYRRALELEPDSAETHSNLLLALHYDPDVSLASLAAEHAAYDRRHAPRAAAPAARAPAGRPLRLGFISPDLRRHPVGYFAVRVLESLDPAACALHIYSDLLVPDELTRRVRAVSTAWNDVAGISHDALAAQIRADDLDVLFDLSGHAGANRLPVFARRPAPTQITWIGYEGTTGLSAMDYLLADRHVLPEAHEPHFRERVLRMPDGYLCYDPPPTAPPVAPLPALERGHATFGSFSNPAKVSPPVVALWSRVLARVPTARLLLKYRGFGDPGVQRRYRELFASHGVAPDRVDLEPWTSYEDYLATYARVDLVLDTFPFAGGTTTCDALWMGVPVVTCAGETFASRHGLTHLSNVGVPETIARDHDHYVDLAVGWVGDLPRLAERRATLRARTAASPLCDGPRFATALLRMLQAVVAERAG